MSFTTPRPVISGKPYAVRSVHDRTPDRLDDFLGDTTFVLDLDGEHYTVAGPGISVDPGVRVFEKDEDGFGKDIRVWMVCPTSTGHAFTATHIGVDVPPQVAHDALS
jgi:hypothetical protein